MKKYRFIFRWFATSWEFTIEAYEINNAINRAFQKILDSGRELDYIYMNIHLESEI